MAAPAPLQESPDFSLVLGGPLYQMLRRAHLTGPALELLRFLVSLPVLILAEMIIHQRIRPIVKSFVERHVVTPEEVPKFYAAIDSAMRMRNSVIAEVALLVFVFTSSHCL